MSRQKSQYKFPRNRPVSSKVSQLKSQMSTFDSYWSRGLVLPDDYLSGLDITALQEIRARAIEMEKLARLKTNKNFFYHESNRLSEIIKERNQIENQRMLDGGG